MIMKKLLQMQEYGAAGLLEEPSRSLFYRKALGLRRYYEHCEIPRYNGELLFPSGRVKRPSYLTGLPFEMSDLQLSCPEAAEEIQGSFCKYRSSVPKEHTIGGNMYTHSMPNYERILKEGLSSYALRADKMRDKDMRDGLAHLLEGIRCYHARCLAYLVSVSANEKLIEALKKVPFAPAENIYEAVVSWNFILYLDSCDNLGCVASGLLPYYRGEDITELLRNLYDNLNVNGGYSMALGTDYNPLTVQCLEASKGKRRPMIELFVDENTPDAVWKKAFEVLRTANGQPAFYNPAVLLGGLQRKFPTIKTEDLKKFCGGGCTETMLAGLSNVGSIDAGINLMLVLEGCIKTELETASSFEIFYGRYLRAVDETVNRVTEAIAKSQKHRGQYNPLPMRTLLIDDCIDKELDYNNGGARYQWSIINFAGLINVIDSMLVIEDLVFANKTYTAKSLIAKLAENDENFQVLLRNHARAFGRDDTQVNEFSTRISADIYATLENRKPYFGEGFLPASIQLNHQVRAGREIGATPDGRKAGEPLCDSLAAIFGKDTKGPTALLNSVASLDLQNALGVPVLNFNINPDFKDEILKALILGYMKQGGVQMQITCISRELLEEAYRNPQEHKNLVVRVGGYSEYFYRLSDEVKRMVIDRTIQSGV